jgi:hypothetical protein
VLVSLLVISLFAVVGQQILDFLGIGIPALQGAGGLLLLIVALELLTDRQDDPSEVPDVNVALVPLGTPLLAGPGAIVATIVFVQQSDGLADRTAIAAGIVAIHLAVYLSLRFSVGITADHPGERHRAADPHRRPAAVGHRRAARRRLGAGVPRRGVARSRVLRPWLGTLVHEPVPPACAADLAGRPAPARGGAGARRSGRASTTSSTQLRSQQVVLADDADVPLDVDAPRRRPRPPTSRLRRGGVRRDRGAGRR